MVQPENLLLNNYPQSLDAEVSCLRIVLHAEVAKLADALASGASSRKGVEVQILSSAFILQILILSLCCLINNYLILCLV